MKLVFFDDFKLGVIKGETVVDVSVVVKNIPRVKPGDVMNGLIERFSEYKEALQKAAEEPARRCRPLN